MDTADQEDRQLMAAISLGDEVALRTLVRKHSPHLYEIAVSILKRHDFAQEAVSNVFISVWQRRETLHIRGNVYPYLSTAVSHQAIEFIRKQLRASEISIDDVPPDDLVEHTRVDHEIQYSEFICAIEGLLKTMPTKRQEVFRMNSFDKRPYKEIAATLGISVHMVQKHMTRARQDIAAALPKLGYDQPGGVS